MDFVLGQLSGPMKCVLGVDKFGQYPAGPPYDTHSRVRLHPGPSLRLVYPLRSVESEAQSL